jgi:hypothetical protein
MGGKRGLEGRCNDLWFKRKRKRQIIVKQDRAEPCLNWADVMSVGGSGFRPYGWVFSD